MIIIKRLSRLNKTFNGKKALELILGILKIQLIMKKPLLNRITVNPKICHGKPTIRNMRYPVELILDLLSSGMTHQEILSDYPSLEEEDIRACLAFAARLTKVKSVNKVLV